MEKEELKQVKRDFIAYLYQYKSKEFLLAGELQKLKEFIDEFHKEGVFLDLNLGDLSTSIENKYNLLKGAFFRSGMDLVFFSDGGELYPANFFAAHILHHFVLKINDILDALDSFREEVLTLDERIQLTRKKKTFKIMALISAITCCPFYIDDAPAVSAMKGMREKFEEIKKLFDEFYKEDPFHDYPKIVEYQLKHYLSYREDVDKDKLTVNLVTLYEIDIDFLRTIKKSEDFSLVRSLYLKYMEGSGLDVSRIVEEPKNRYFTSKRHDVFDPTKYLQMSVEELVMTTFSEELEEAGDIFGNREDFEDLKSVLEMVGVTVLDPVYLTEEDLKNSDEISNKKDKKEKKRKWFK